MRIAPQLIVFTSQKSSPNSLRGRRGGRHAESTPPSASERRYTETPRKVILTRQKLRLEVTRKSS